MSAIPGGLDLVEVGHRLDPDEVHAAGHEGRGLLAKDIDRVVVFQRPERGDDFATGPDITGHQGCPTRRVDLRPGQDGGGPVELIHPGLVAVHAQAQPVAAERVGHDDLRSGIQVAPVDAPHDVRVAKVPELRWVTELEPGGEEHRAHRAVRHDRSARIEHGPEAGARCAAIDRAAGRQVGERVGVNHDRDALWCAVRSRGRSGLAPGLAAGMSASTHAPRGFHGGHDSCP